MVIEYETRKPIDPFRKTFPTKLVLTLIVLITIFFSISQCVRNPQEDGQQPEKIEHGINTTQELMPKQFEQTESEGEELQKTTESTTTSPRESTREPKFSEALWTIDDLQEPKFPEVDRELTSVI